MKKVEEHGASISGINITPIIDITLVLLIIMLVAAPVLNIPNMDVALPEAFTLETKGNNISVSLDKDTRVAVNDAIIPLSDLPAFLNKELKLKKDAIVIVRADKDVDYVKVENLIETIKEKTRATRIAVATKQKTASRVP